MKPHTKIYLKHYGYCETDVIPCEICGQKAVDLHHIKYRSQGGTDGINNIIALCRVCHNKAHSDKQFNETLKEMKTKEFIK